MDVENQEKRAAMMLGPIGALIIVLGTIFDLDFVKGIGVGVGVIALILLAKGWRSERTRSN
jgi:hypothetical protein